MVHTQPADQDGLQILLSTSCCLQTSLRTSTFGVEHGQKTEPTLHVCLEPPYTLGIYFPCSKPPSTVWGNLRHILPRLGRHTARAHQDTSSAPCLFHKLLTVSESPSYSGGRACNVRPSADHWKSIQAWQLVGIPAEYMHAVMADTICL